MIKPLLLVLVLIISLQASALEKSIMKHEGFSSTAYLDPVSITTIGYGRNLEDRGITEEEALFLLQNDIARIKNELKERLPVYSTLNKTRQEVLIEMAYNMGTSALLGFKRMIYYLKVKNYKKAAICMVRSKWHRDFVRWARIGGYSVKKVRSLELARIMKTGKR